MRIFAISLMLGMFLSGMAFAQPDPVSDLGGYLVELFRAVTTFGTNWPMVVTLTLIGLVALSRKLLAKYVPFFDSKFGAMILVFLASASGATYTALRAGAEASWTVVKAALVTAFVAMGGFSALKEALREASKLVSKVPVVGKYLTMLIDLVLMFLGSSGDAAKKKAEKAGQDAVAKNPAGGAGSVVGKIDVVK